MARFFASLAPAALVAATLSAPFAASANTGSLDDLLQEASEARYATVANAPSLPVADAASDAVCAVVVDPLPAVLTLHLGPDAQAGLTACLSF
ncbi:MAG: hypothetical protein AAFO93_02905 [Pseudomonadota bacterium]